MVQTKIIIDADSWPQFAPRWLFVESFCLKSGLFQQMLQRLFLPSLVAKRASICVPLTLVAPLASLTPFTLLRPLGKGFSLKSSLFPKMRPGLLFTLFGSWHNRDMHGRIRVLQPTHLHLAPLLASLVRLALIYPMSAILQDLMFEKFIVCFKRCRKDYFSTDNWHERVIFTPHVLRPTCLPLVSLSHLVLLATLYSASAILQEFLSSKKHLFVRALAPTSARPHNTALRRPPRPSRPFCAIPRHVRPSRALTTPCRLRFPEVPLHRQSWCPLSPDASRPISDIALRAPQALCFPCVTIVSFYIFFRRQPRDGAAFVLRFCFLPARVRMQASFCVSMFLGLTVLLPPAV